LASKFCGQSRAAPIPERMYSRASESVVIQIVRLEAWPVVRPNVVRSTTCAASAASAMELGVVMPTILHQTRLR
jgi:hypothetical protein